MKITFLKTEVIRDDRTKAVIQTFSEGESYDLGDEAAAYWISCGSAEGAKAEAAPAKAAPVEVEADTVADEESTPEVAEKAKVSGFRRK